MNYQLKAERLIARDYVMSATAIVCGQRATWRIAACMDDRYTDAERAIFRRALGIHPVNRRARRTLTTRILRVEVRHA